MVAGGSHCFKSQSIETFSCTIALLIHLSQLGTCKKKEEKTRRLVSIAQFGFALLLINNLILIFIKGLRENKLVCNYAWAQQFDVEISLHRYSSILFCPIG